MPGTNPTIAASSSNLLNLLISPNSDSMPCCCYTSNAGYTFVQVIIFFEMLAAIRPQHITNMQFFIPYKFQLLQTATHTFGCTAVLPFYIPYPGFHLAAPVGVIILIG